LRDPPSGNGQAQPEASQEGPSAGLWDRARPRNKTFDRKAEAERFLANVESSKNTGSFVDSVLARITVGDWATHWLGNQTHLKPSTHERYAGIIREHIRPKWDPVKLANVSHADVQKWVTALSKTRSPATVRKVHRVLSLILNMAVKDGAWPATSRPALISHARPRRSSDS
jgi:Phage integrase, N-terminal SAM-like domain